MRINIHELLSVDPDLTVYEVRPEDKKQSAAMSVADWKTTLLTINVLSRRIQALLKDVERAEARIDNLEQTVADLQK